MRAEAASTIHCFTAGAQLRPLEQDAHKGLIADGMGLVFLLALCSGRNSVRQAGSHWQALGTAPGLRIFSPGAVQWPLSEARDSRLL